MPSETGNGCESELTKHHNIPGSRGGSDEELNLSIVKRSRHTQFHKNWATNHTPCSLTRLMAVHAIGHNGETMHPETIENLFQITTMAQWHRLYLHGAINPITLPNAPHNSEKIARYTETHLIEEQLLLRQALHALTNGGVLPSQNSQFLHGYLRFFGTHSPREGLQRMYKEKSHGHLTWVRPMQDETRTAILEALQKPVVPLEAGSMRDIEYSLIRQEEYIVRYFRQWGVIIPSDPALSQAPHLTRRQQRHLLKNGRRR